MFKIKPLNFLLGRSGYGKSYFIAEKITELVKSRALSDTLKIGDKIYILVPDQYTVAAERFYIEKLGERAMAFVKVMSFKRFTSAVFNEVGGLAYEFIGNGGKIALISKALSEVSIFFKYYPEKYYNIKFINMLSDTIKELKSGGINSEELFEIAKKENNDKLADIANIYGSFEAFLNGGYFDPDDNYSRLCETLEENKLFENSFIFIDNFKTFSQKELNVIVALYKQNANIYTSFCAEKLDISDSWGNFGIVSENASRLAGMLKKISGSINIIKFNESKRYKSEELKFLEQHIFADETISFNAPLHDILLYKASDMLDELEYVASEICRLVRDCNYKYSDFVIAARDIESYSGFLDPVFGEYNIPLFYHKRTPLRQKSIMTLITSLFSILADGYSIENVFSCLKTGFFPYSITDVSLFENYAVKWKIKRTSFLREFKMGFGGLSKSIDETEEETQKLIIVNNIRKDFTDIIENFKLKIADKNVREISKEFYNLLCALNISQTVENMGIICKKYGENSLYSEQLQVYDLVINALDELVLTRGEDVIDINNYADLFVSIIDCNDIAIIPTSLDEVMAGNIDKLPFMSPKCVFIIGLNDSVFPQRPEDSSIFTDEDKKLVALYGAEIGMDLEKKLRYEYFLGYLGFSSAAEKLYLSYAENIGGISRPSPFLSAIKNLFPLLEQKSSPIQNEGRGLDERIQTEKSAFSICSRLNIKELFDYFRQTPYNKFLDAETNKNERLSPDSSAALFGKNMSLSASRLDKFYNCSFSYFCRYGMKINPERKVALGSLETGNFLHAALQTLMKEAIDDDTVDLYNKIIEFGNNYIKDLFRGEKPSASFTAYFEQLLMKVYRLLLAFKTEQEQSKFKPEAFELEISDTGACPPIKIPVEDGFIKLYGVVDRIDSYKKDGITYIRIIDYKSGRKTFDLQKIYHGLDTQMLMYLYSILENKNKKDEHFVPAGIMYVNVNPVIVTIERGKGPDDAEQELQKKKKRSGLFIQNEDILKAMDNELSGKYIPINFKSRLQPLATTEEFGMLFKHIKNLLTKMGKELFDGNTEKNPILTNNHDSCAYCDYKPFCYNEKRQRSMKSVNIDNIFGLLKGGKKNADVDSGTEKSD